MKASIEDVARQAGVSTATVSRAFSRPDMVSAKTRAKVMEAAQQLDFSVSRMAGILKSGRSHRVALLVGSSKLDWFTSRIIEGLNEVLRSAGYDLVIQPIGDAGAREEFFDELPVRGNADAVIVSSFAITPAEIRRLNTTRIPLIGINTASQGFTASVGIDDKAGIRLIVRHLTTLGHRNLLYLYETFDATMGFSSHNRVTGFLEACSELDGVTGQTMDMQAGDDPVDAALTALLARDDAPTALCFHQDSLAIPLFFRLRQCGMAIPTDLSVTGFDNSTFSGEVGLTTVRQKPYDMAVAAARKALDLIEGAPWTSRTRSSRATAGTRLHRRAAGARLSGAESVVIRAAVVGLGFAVPASYRHERDADDDGQEDGGERCGAADGIGRCLSGLGVA